MFLNFTNLQLCVPSFFLGYPLLTDCISVIISNRISVLSYLYFCYYDYGNLVRLSLVCPKDFRQIKNLPLFLTNNTQDNLLNASIIIHLLVMHWLFSGELLSLLKI